MNVSLLRGRVVLKIGSSTITGENGFVDQAYLAELARAVARLKAAGGVPVIVSSGAVALGRERLGVRHRPRQIHQRQALAAVGQVALMGAYAEHFAKVDLLTAQVLLTRDVVTDREKYLNAKATFEELLRRGVVPIVNENDTVVIDELKFGDNDTLSATTAQMVLAKVLVLMTDVPGFYTANPSRHQEAHLIDEADVADTALDDAAEAKGSDLGSGGMLTKLQAARMAAMGGVQTRLIQGKPLTAFYHLLEGRHTGTLLTNRNSPKSAKKQWVALQPQKGRLVVNEGAGQSLIHGKKSLLSSGVVAVEGEFKRGDAVEIGDERGLKLALGLSNYSSQDAAKIAGCQSTRIDEVLGYRFEDELVHRDFLVVLDGPSGGQGAGAVGSPAEQPAGGDVDRH